MNIPKSVYRELCNFCKDDIRFASNIVRLLSGNYITDKMYLDEPLIDVINRSIAKQDIITRWENKRNSKILLKAFARNECLDFFDLSFKQLVMIISRISIELKLINTCWEKVCIEDIVRVVFPDESNKI